MPQYEIVIIDLPSRPLVASVSLQTASHSQYTKVLMLDDVDVSWFTARAGYRSSHRRYVAINRTAVD